MNSVVETMSMLGLRERRRLERDLHDGAQQRLVSLALTLRMAREKLGPDAGEAGRLLDRSRQELDEALKEIRELARGIHPTVLSERGLGAAVEALAHRAPLPVEVGELPAHSHPPEAETRAGREARGRPACRAAPCRCRAGARFAPALRGHGPETILRIARERLSDALRGSRWANDESGT